MSNQYPRFMATLGVSLIVMFVLSMSMVRTLDHFYINLSNFYMALTMVAAMGVIMLISMWGMFKNKRLNIFLLGAFAIGFLAVLTLGRSETFVGDEQFLKSMIPHHSRAILVCQESTLTDPEVIALCEQIVKSQTEEIQQMQEILKRY